MENERKISSNKAMEVKFILFYGILLGCIINVADYIASYFLHFPFFGFAAPLWSIWKSLVQWPVVLVPGIAIAAVILVMRHTVVTVTAHTVVISRLGHKVVCSIGDFASSTMKEKIYDIFWLRIKVRKAYLLFYILSGTKKYRLFEFSDTEMEAVLQAIREQKMKNMPVEEKLEIQDSLNQTMMSQTLRLSAASGNDFSVALDVIKDYERKMIFRISRIWLCLTAVMLLLVIFEFSGGTDRFKLLFYLVLLGIMLLSVPFQLLQLKRKAKSYPGSILIDGEHIWLGESCFSFSTISYIKMTSPRKRSDSIFPVQYYLTIKSMGEKKKYWLGSKASYGQYGRLCRTLEQAMAMYPQKLKYKK